MKILLSLKSTWTPSNSLRFQINQQRNKEKFPPSENSQQKIPPNVIYSNLRVNTSRKYQNVSFLYIYNIIY